MSNIITNKEIKKEDNEIIKPQITRVLLPSSIPLNLNMPLVIKFKRITLDGQIPTKGSIGAAGYDLHASHDCIIPKICLKVEIVNIEKKEKEEKEKEEEEEEEKEEEENIYVSKALIKTDIACKIPDTHYGRVAPRSGISWKHHVHVGAGVIDSDYRGNIGIVLYNLSSKDFIIKKGDRVAQLIFERIENNAMIEEVTDLDESDRGSGGYGSTGV